MNHRIIPAAVAVLALAGCGSPGKYDSTPADSTGAPTGSSSGPTLELADTSAGNVLVDSSGHAVYFYDVDKPGETTSACSGVCASLWPAVPAPAHPSLGTGVHGKLGTVKAVDGSSQLTLNGHPLYTYTKDEDSEDAYGQGYDGIWWVVDGSGAKVTASATPTSRSGGYGAGY